MVHMDIALPQLTIDLKEIKVTDTAFGSVMLDARVAGLQVSFVGID